MSCTQFCAPWLRRRCRDSINGTRDYTYAPPIRAEREKNKERKPNPLNVVPLLKSIRQGCRSGHFIVVSTGSPKSSVYNRFGIPILSTKCESTILEKKKHRDFLRVSFKKSDRVIVSAVREYNVGVLLRILGPRGSFHPSARYARLSCITASFNPLLDFNFVFIIPYSFK